MPRSSADGFLVTPERSLAVSFELKEPLAMGSTMALNWAQRRFFVNSTGSRKQLERAVEAKRIVERMRFLPTWPLSTAQGSWMGCYKCV